MRIGGVQRRLGSDLYSHLITGSVAPLPVGSGAPFRFIFRSVLEITVLHQLGIQTAISGIVYILEKDTHQIGADVLCRIGEQSEGGLQRLERCKTHTVAAHGLCMQGIAVGAVVAELLEAAHKRCGNLALPSAVSPRAHLRRGRAAAVIGKSRIYGSIGVDLRTPFHKVGRFDYSHRLLPFGKLPCGHPHAVGWTLHELGLKHLFHVAPRAEIGVYERVAPVQLLPFHAVGAPGELQAAIPVGIGIRENNRDGWHERDALHLRQPLQSRRQAPCA